MVITLKPATSNDIPFLTDVVVEALKAQGRWYEDEASWREGFSRWSQELIRGSDPTSTLYVIEKNHKAVGRLRVKRMDKEIFLAGLQLKPEVQNQGVGTHIVTLLDQEAHDAGKDFTTSVEKDNPHALRLYRRLNMMVVGETQDEYLLRAKRDSA